MQNNGVLLYASGSKDSSTSLAATNPKDGISFFHMSTSRGDDDMRISATSDNYDPGLNNNNRFVAGNKFFNYDQFGALREGGSVKFYSRNYLGLVMATFASSFVYGVLRYVLRPTLIDFLDLHRSENPTVMESLLSLPTSLALFAGLFSDLCPIAGYRRKSYMVLGCVLSFIMCAALAVLSYTVDPDNHTQDEEAQYVGAYMVLIICAALGTMITSVAVQARIIELSQRETLSSRGQLQIDYLIFRSVVEAICLWLAYYLTTYIKATKLYHLDTNMVWSYALTAAVALLPLPFMLHNCSERSLNDQASQHGVTDGMVDSIAVAGVPRASRMDGLRAFFRICQQRAVWQIVLFICILVSFLRFYIGTANAALSALCSVDKNIAQRSAAIGYFPFIMILVLWKFYWSNSSWRKCVTASVGIAVGLKTLRAVLVLYVPSVRGQTIYDTFDCLMDMSDALVTIFSLIPATEIAENGSEGAMIGLLMSAKSILVVAMRTLCWKWVNSLIKYKVAQGMDKLLMWLLISYAVMALSFFSITVLPRQKLDAQQLRVYGGYSQLSSAVLLLLFLGLFVFSTAVNLKYMLKLTV